MRISRRSMLQATAAGGVAAVVAGGSSSPAAAAGPAALTTLDLAQVHGYDVHDPAQALLGYGWLHAAATLQGIVNRDAARALRRLPAR